MLMTVLSWFLTFLIVFAGAYGCYWLIGHIREIPPPLLFLKIALEVVVCVILLVYLLGMLTGYNGLHPIIIGR